MAKKTSTQKRDPRWVEAKRRCRLNQEDIRMAKALGLNPRKLVKNIPSPTQQWKQPVKFWIRDLYRKRFPADERAQKVKKVTKPVSGHGSNKPLPAAYTTWSNQESPESGLVDDVLWEEYTAQYAAEETKERQEK